MQLPLVQRKGEEQQPAHNRKVTRRNESQIVVKSLTRGTLVSTHLDRAEFPRKTENGFHINRSTTFIRSSSTTSTPSNEELGSLPRIF